MKSEMQWHLASIPAVAAAQRAAENVSTAEFISFRACCRYAPVKYPNSRLPSDTHRNRTGVNAFGVCRLERVFNKRFKIVKWCSHTFMYIEANHMRNWSVNRSLTSSNVRIFCTGHRSPKTTANREAYVPHDKHHVVAYVLTDQPNLPFFGCVPIPNRISIRRFLHRCLPTLLQKHCSLLTATPPPHPVLPFFFLFTVECNRWEWDNGNSVSAKVNPLNLICSQRVIRSLPHHHKCKAYTFYFVMFGTHKPIVCKTFCVYYEFIVLQSRRFIGAALPIASNGILLKFSMSFRLAHER